MQIHNFFSDVLLSIRVLFDSYIFPSEFIRSYEFNIANRNFTLSKNDYHTQYEFPAAIISLTDDSYSFGERPNVIQRTQGFNFNQIPVLYDSITEQYINIQEEHTQVRMSVIINCESQLQAKEIEFRIKRNLPLNKFISILKFTSFLEIEPTTMTSLGIKYDENDITNLYTKLNRNTGTIEYCYSVNYEPLIRLDSSSTSISESTQRSFSINLDLTYQIQMPMWVCSDKDYKTIEGINVDFQRFDNEPISQNSVRPIINIRTDDPYGDIKHLVRRNLIISNLKDFDFSEIIPGTYVFNIKFREDDFIISPDYIFNIFDINGNIRYNIQPTLIDKDLNQITFQFSEEEYTTYYNATLTNPIILQFIEDRTELIESRES